MTHGPFPYWVDEFKGARMASVVDKEARFRTWMLLAWVFLLQIGVTIFILKVAKLERQVENCPCHASDHDVVAGEHKRLK